MLSGASRGGAGVAGVSQGHAQFDRLAEDDIDRLTPFAELRVPHQDFARADRHRMAPAVQFP